MFRTFQNYGKIHGKLTILMAIFNSYVKLPEGKVVDMFDGFMMIYGELLNLDEFS